MYTVNPFLLHLGCVFVYIYILCQPPIYFVLREASLLTIFADLCGSVPLATTWTLISIH